MSDAQDNVVEPQVPAGEPVTEQPTETEAPVSEDVKPSADDSDDSESGKGDLRVALQQERQRRQQVEQALRDPNFIYQQARSLGLTEEQAEAAADSGTLPTTPQTPAAPAMPDIRQAIRFERSMEKAIDKYPDLAKDDELGVMVTALINRGYEPLQAADKIHERMNKVVAQAKADGRSEAKAEVSDKERAQTAPITTTNDSTSVEVEDLRRRMRSLDKKVQTEAYVEWRMVQNRNKK